MAESTTQEPKLSQQIGVRREVFKLVNKLHASVKDEDSGTEDELEQQYWDPFDKSGLRKYSSSDKSKGGKKDGGKGKHSKKERKLKQEKEEIVRQRAEMKKIKIKERKHKREQKDKENKKQYDKDRAVIQKGGSFTIQVHIIECRDLKGKDWTDQSDPVITVKIFDSKKSTRTIKETKNPIYDQVLYFDFNLESGELSKGRATITAFDANRLMRNEQIGSFEFDLSEIYYRKGHEIHMQWVALTNTEILFEDLNDDEKGDDNKGQFNKGIEGYLRCSIVVLGPNDEQVTHDDADNWKQAEGEKLSDGMVLVTPGVTQSPHLLTVKIHKLKNLCNADKHSFSESLRRVFTKKEQLDPFVYVEYAGVRIRTDEVYNGINCEVCCMSLNRFISGWII